MILSESMTWMRLSLAALMRKLMLMFLFILMEFYHVSTKLHHGPKSQGI